MRSISACPVKDGLQDLFACQESWHFVFVVFAAFPNEHRPSQNKAHTPQGQLTCLRVRAEVVGQDPVHFALCASVCLSAECRARGRETEHEVRLLGHIPRQVLSSSLFGELRLGDEAGGSTPSCDTCSAAC